MKYRCLLFVSICCWFLALPATLHAELVVVVNARCGVAAMTRNEVINVFFGRNRQYFNGIAVQPVDLSDAHPDRALFYNKLVGKDLSEVNAYWARQVFSGRMPPLARAASSDEVLRWVVSHPGGIGFMDSAKVDARVRVVYEMGQ
jgi:hypothetical protein